MTDQQKNKLVMKAFLSVVNVCSLMGINYGKLGSQTQHLLLEAYRQGGVDMLEELRGDKK